MITTTIFWQFVILNFFNVVINTIRSLCTVKGGKWTAAISNAICYGYYTIIIVITATYDIPLIQKCIAVAIVNFVGVLGVKIIEEKITKEKTWIFFTIANCTEKEITEISQNLTTLNIKNIYTELVENKKYSIQVFSKNCKESDLITALLDNYNIKYSAIESQL